jgi:hypothetical protein
VNRRGNPSLIPGNPGNSGGKKGRSGAKPLAFKRECDRLTDAAVLPRIEEYLATGNASDPAWRWCAEFVAEYSKRKAAQEVEQTGELTIRIVRGGRGD